MMKLIKFLLISVSALFVVADTLACYIPEYPVSDLYMYRVCESVPEEVEWINPMSKENCLAWQDITSQDIPLKDIYEVVYKMKLEEFEKLYRGVAIEHCNEFCKWITSKDTTILEFLYVAKTNEYIRSKVNSAWYYPTMDIGTQLSLEDVLDRALTSKDKKLRDRYLLQAVRALVSLERYADCMRLWIDEVSKLPEENVMRQLISPYIAGVEIRLKESGEWAKFSAQIEGVKSLQYRYDKSEEQLTEVQGLSLVCKRYPNNKQIPHLLQSFVRELEEDAYMLRYYDFYNIRNIYNTNYEELYSLSLKMAKNKSVKNRALWYYTLAFLSELNNKLSDASSFLSMAEKLVKDELLEGSIKVMRIYIDAKISKYDRAYERKLHNQLKWLDNKIAKDITEDVVDKVAEGAYEMQRGESFYYWNDMLRRIVLSVVSPRMIEAGKHVRALQLTNMADNRLLSLVDKQYIYYWGENSEEEYVPIKRRSFSLEEFRYSDEFNHLDYSNDFFQMIDTLGVNVAVKYYARTKNPQDEFDNFLNQRGYVTDDYLCDILGTKYLRNMRYTKALSYLSKVKYMGHLNVRMVYNPFSEKRVYGGEDNYFRFEFAKEMCKIEKQIANEKNPNIKAQLMVKYAIAIRNSFGFCWELTQYYKGERYYYPYEKYSPIAMKKAEKIVSEAMAMVTDCNVAAELNYQLCNFKTVAEEYPDTEKGKLVRGECDKLIDYHAESYRGKNYWD